MTFLIQKDEPSNASRRIPCRVFTSNGTGPDTGAQNDAVLLWLPSGATISCSSNLTAIHAAQGMYYEQLTQSEVSLLGPHALYHTVGDFPQHLANFEVVNSNPLSTLSAISNVTLHAGTHSSVTIQGLSNYANISNVTLHAGTHSSATVQGLSNYANISNVTLHAGTHSNVTIQGVTRVNSGVTLNANTHSGATIAGIVDGGIVASTLASGVLTSAKFAAGAIDAAALATDAGQEIADRMLLRDIAGGADSGRSVGQALYALRNKVSIEGSTMTVYGTDDSTSAWTASITTGTNPISGMDPVG